MLMYTVAAFNLLIFISKRLNMRVCIRAPVDRARAGTKCGNTRDNISGLEGVRWNSIQADGLLNTNICHEADRLVCVV
jgi:hypothetical protein